MIIDLTQSQIEIQSKLDLADIMEQLRKVSNDPDLELKCVSHQWWPTPPQRPQVRHDNLKND